MVAAQVSYSVPFRIRFNRVILRFGFRLLFHLLATVRITGKENIPREGGYLIAVNHVSYSDPPFVIAFWPVAPEAVGAVDIWSKPGQGQLASWYGGIPVHRGEIDRNLMDKMTSILLSGRPLVIAPEGTRSHKPGLQRGQPGIAYVTDIVNVPVIPVGIVGTTDDFLNKALHFQRPVLELRIGKPIQLPHIIGKGEERREARQQNVDRIMTAIAELLPPEYRGVYGSKPSTAG